MNTTKSLLTKYIFYLYWIYTLDLLGIIIIIIIIIVCCKQWNYILKLKLYPSQYSGRGSDHFSPRSPYRLGCPAGPDGPDGPDGPGDACFSH